MPPRKKKATVTPPPHAPVVSKHTENDADDAMSDVSIDACAEDVVTDLSKLVKMQGEHSDEDPEHVDLPPEQGDEDNEEDSVDADIEDEVVVSKKKQRGCSSRMPNEFGENDDSDGPSDDDAEELYDASEAHRIRAIMSRIREAITCAATSSKHYEGSPLEKDKGYVSD